MNAVRPEVSLPLLPKDFVIDSYQLLDAATRGADGVLLLAALLSETEMQRLIGEADSWAWTRWPRCTRWRSCTPHCAQERRWLGSTTATCARSNST